MCDFWLFPEIKFTMKGNRFDTIPDIEAARKEHFRASTNDEFQSICVPEAYFSATRRISVLHTATEEAAKRAQ
jgi:hypothetical protein